MHRGPFPALLPPLILLLAAFALACGDDSGEGGAETVTYAFGLDSQVIASGGFADNVSAIEVAPDGRIFFAEQYKGTVRIMNTDGTMQTAPFTQVLVADWLGLDWGLTGLALDPDFENNHYVYLFYTEPVRTATYEENGATVEHPVARPRIVRFTEVNGAATEETLISDNFPETSERHPGFNANGEIHFGPDGLLYASVGDYDLFQDQPDVITDPSTPIGKLLRMNPDGSPAAGNPFEGEEGADTRVYAYGFREPFSFTFSPDGTIYGNDNTTVSCEELNIIEAGANYGWPQMGEFPYADCSVGPGEQPIFHFTREGQAPGSFLSFVEVSAMAFLEGSAYPGLSDGLIVCESQRSPVNNVTTRGVLRRLTLSSEREVALSEQIVNDCKGGMTVHNGEIYYANSNELRKLVQGSGTTPRGNPQIPQLSP